MFTRKKSNEFSSKRWAFLRLCLNKPSCCLWFSHNFEEGSEIFFTNDDYSKKDRVRLFKDLMVLKRSTIVRSPTSLISLNLFVNLEKILEKLEEGRNLFWHQRTLSQEKSDRIFDLFRTCRLDGISAADLKTGGHLSALCSYHHSQLKSYPLMNFTIFKFFYCRSERIPKLFSLIFINCLFTFPLWVRFNPYL